MTIPDQPNDELNNPNDPAKIGSDQGSGFNADDDPRAMPRTPLNAVDVRDEAGSRSQERSGQSGDDGLAAPQGSDFDNQRRHVAGGINDQYGALGRGESMGRADFNGDEDRGYDQSSYRGGLGTSGGREDLSDRNVPDSNAFTGGYGGGDYDRPSKEQTNDLGLNSRNSTDISTPDADNLTTPGTETT